MQFLRDLFLCAVVIGCGFVAPFCLCDRLFELPVEISLMVGWVICSILTAWLMGKGDDDDD